MTVIRINDNMIEVGGIPCMKGKILNVVNTFGAWFPVDSKAYTLQHSEALNDFIINEKKTQ